jgi:hypothetical protein
MNLVDALKKRKMLVGEISELTAKIRNSNNWEEKQCDIEKLSVSKKPSFDAKKGLADLIDKKAQLSALKAAIFKANVDIHALIVELGEIKDLLSFLSSIDTNEQRRSSILERYGRADKPDTPIVMIEIIHSQISEELKIASIEKSKNRIVEIEKALNLHNFTKEIDL